MGVFHLQHPFAVSTPLGEPFLTTHVSKIFFSTLIKSTFKQIMCILDLNVHFRSIHLRSYWVKNNNIIIGSICRHIRFALNSASVCPMPMNILNEPYVQVRGCSQMTSSAKGGFQIKTADEGGFAEDDVIFYNHFRANFC